MPKNVVAAISLAVIALATLMLGNPEWRTGAAKVTLGILWLTVSTSNAYRLHKAGMLSMTPGQIFHAKERPKTGLLELIAILVGVGANIYFILNP